VVTRAKLSLSLYLMGGGPSRAANVDTQNKMSVIKIPQIPTAAR
jgi:hypothetical protein